jgi:hypothetical protein
VVTVGNNVTLRSLLPETIVTVRVSGFQPLLGIATTTVWSPIARLTLIGVTLPVFAPSMVTLAPVGNDVTFSEPWPLCATAEALNRISAQRIISFPFNIELISFLLGETFISIGSMATIC